MFSATAALTIAHNDCKDNEEKLSISVKSWISEVCVRLKLVELWERYLFQRFGETAKNCRAVQKLVAHLCTKLGLAKVAACIDQNIPCHGKTSSGGILECRALVQELEKCKAGGLPPPAVQPDLAEVAKAPTKRESASRDEDSLIIVAAIASDEALRCSLAAFADTFGSEQKHSPPGVCQRDFELFTKATDYLEPVTFFPDEREFNNCCRAVMANGRSFCIIDLGTSRKSHIGGAIEVFAFLMANCENSRLVTTLLNRTDLIHDIGIKLNKALPQWYHVLLTHHVADVFKAAYARVGRTFSYISAYHHATS